MKFQIRQNYGQSTYGYLYFETEETELEKLERMAIDKVRNEWQATIGKYAILAPPNPCFPTVQVVEYDMEKKQKKRNGISFKCLWR